MKLHLINSKLDRFSKFRLKANSLLQDILPLLEEAGLAKGYGIQWTTDGPSLYRSEEHPEWNYQDKDDHFLSYVIEELKEKGVYE